MAMKNLQDLIITPDVTIVNVMKAIDKQASRFVAVVDSSGALMGTVTDGDIRRGLISGVQLSDSAARVMNTKPYVVFDDEDFITGARRAKELGMDIFPVVTRDKQIKDIVKIKNLDPSHLLRKEPVILMAGGQGTRLRPHTLDTPKPLLKISSTPMLETIVSNFAMQGFYKFYLAVNYKADMVIDYFGDGRKWGIEINYIREEKELGTAGALSLVREELSAESQMFVMNGDILTKANFGKILEEHKARKACATVCICESSYEVPYGVVDLDPSGQVTHLIEKPKITNNISAGIYLLNRECLELIPHNSSFGMPELLGELIERRSCVYAHKITDYWLDVGRAEDFERAQADFKSLF
jgi:dTDP-glucose pyrophosphorylase